MALTTVTINFRTENVIPKGGYVVLEFDHINYVFPDDRSKISCTTNLAQKANCIFTKEY
jgi:hypothetical protein